MQGSFFVISVFLQQVRGYNAIQTGLMLVPATIGILLASAAAERLARRRTQRFLIRRGFAVMIVGLVLLLALVREHSSIWTFVPGLFLIGAGIGVMLTSSVNVVQSAFPERDQGDISGSRAAFRTSAPRWGWHWLARSSPQQPSPATTRSRCR